MADRKLDGVTLRALRLALAGARPEDAAAELLLTADGSWPLLNATLIRLDRALTVRWSEVESRAADAVRLALWSAERARRTQRAAG
jgi:hypothetical protein